MVHAILDGRKTQTRRVIKPQPEAHFDCFGPMPPIDFDFWLWRGHKFKGRPALLEQLPVLCPYGQPGDRLWVRETFLIDHYEFYPRGPLPKTKPSQLDVGDDVSLILYRADGTCCEQLGECQCEGKGATWRPSIYMPRWASRITLEIVSVRVERLQEISEADVIAEGIRLRGVSLTDSQFLMQDYAALWESINGKGSWERNDWLWRIEFRKL